MILYIVERTLRWAMNGSRRIGMNDEDSEKFAS